MQPTSDENVGVGKQHRIRHRPRDCGAAGQDQDFPLPLHLRRPNSIPPPADHAAAAAVAVVGCPHVSTSAPKRRARCGAGKRRRRGARAGDAVGVLDARRERPHQTIPREKLPLHGHSHAQLVRSKTRSSVARAVSAARLKRRGKAERIHRRSGAPSRPPPGSATRRRCRDATQIRTRTRVDCRRRWCWRRGEAPRPNGARDMPPRRLIAVAPLPLLRVAAGADGATRRAGCAVPRTAACP